MVAFCISLKTPNARFVFFLVLLLIFSLLSTLPKEVIHCWLGFSNFDVIWGCDWSMRVPGGIPPYYSQTHSSKSQHFCSFPWVSLLGECLWVPCSMNKHCHRFRRRSENKKEMPVIAENSCHRALDGLVKSLLSLPLGHRRARKKFKGPGRWFLREHSKNQTDLCVF